MGRNPSKDILALESDDIKVEPDIEDIRTAYSRSSVLLAPIRNGRGTKYKILEAMATKTPIVGTNLATEGIEVINGKHAFVADSPDQLYKKTVEVLTKSSVGEKLAEQAFKLVSLKYNWKNYL